MSNVRLRRLAADFERMQSYVRRHPRVTLVQTEGSPPEKYQLQYVVRSLRQVGGEMKTIDTHLVEIVLPRNYPRTPPQCRMLSPVFHPNIAPHAICVGDHWGAGEPLESIVVRIGEMLAYQSYNVKSPLNGDAARWVEQNLDRIPTDTVSMLAEEDAAPPTGPLLAGQVAVATQAAAQPPIPPLPDGGYGVGPIADGALPPPNMYAAPASPYDQAPYAPQQPYAPQPFAQQPYVQQPPPYAPLPPYAQQPPFAPPPPPIPAFVPPPPVTPPPFVAPPAAPAAEAAPAPQRIRVSCPRCQKTYAVPATNRGRTAKCQNCGEQFTL